MHKIIVLGFVTITYSYSVQTVVRFFVLSYYTQIYLQDGRTLLWLILERANKVFIIFTAETTNCSNQSTDLSKYEIIIQPFL